VSLSPSSIIGTSQWTVMLGAWEGNCVLSRKLWQPSLPPGLWLQSSVGWLLRTRISCGTLWSHEYATVFTFNMQKSILVLHQRYHTFCTS